jgi:cell division protein FtsL
VADSSVIRASVRQSEQGGSRQLLFCNAALLVLVLVSAFAAIYSTHACRALYTQLQVLESSQWYLHEDYGRLLLEQSTWASHYRVEKVARGDLGMAAPDLALFKVVPQ